MPVIDGIEPMSHLSTLVVKDGVPALECSGSNALKHTLESHNSGGCRSSDFTQHKYQPIYLLRAKDPFRSLSVYSCEERLVQPSRFQGAVVSQVVNHRPE